jgi:hypothetical protein
MHAAVAYARAAFLATAARPMPGPYIASSATCPDTVSRRRRSPPGPAWPPQARARPALDIAACLPWPLVHLTLSTGQPLMSPASLSRRLAPQPPNLSRQLWTSPTRPPPLDATSRLLRPPSAGRLGPLSGIAPPTDVNECPSKI